MVALVFVVEIEKDRRGSLAEGTRKVIDTAKYELNKHDIAIKATIMDLNGSIATETQDFSDVSADLFHLLAVVGRKLSSGRIVALNNVTFDFNVSSVDKANKETGCPYRLEGTSKNTSIFKLIQQHEETDKGFKSKYQEQQIVFLEDVSKLLQTLCNKDNFESNDATWLERLLNNFEKIGMGKQMEIRYVNIKNIFEFLKSLAFQKIPFSPIAITSLAVEEALGRTKHGLNRLNSIKDFVRNACNLHHQNTSSFYGTTIKFKFIQCNTILKF